MDVAACVLLLISLQSGIVVDWYVTTSTTDEYLCERHKEQNH